MSLVVDRVAFRDASDREGAARDAEHTHVEFARARRSAQAFEDLIVEQIVAFFVDSYELRVSRYR